MSLTIRPLTLREANAYVAAHHRHNRPVVGHRYSIGCFDGDRMCGVAIVKKKSYIELAAYMEKERENGAVWLKARSDSGSRIESREYNGRPIYAEVR